MAQNLRKILKVGFKNIACCVFNPVGEIGQFWDQQELFKLFKVFTIVTFSYLQYPVFLLNFRKIPRVVSKNYAFGVLAPICKIRQEFFQSIHHCQFYLLVVSSCFFKFEKNLLSESLEPCLGILINGPFFGQSDHCCHSCLLIVLYCCTLLQGALDGSRVFSSNFKMKVSLIKWRWEGEGGWRAEDLFDQSYYLVYLSYCSYNSFCVCVCLCYVPRASMFTLLLVKPFRFAFV